MLSEIRAFELLKRPAGADELVGRTFLRTGGSQSAADLPLVGFDKEL